MRPIPKKLRYKLSNDPFYKKCCIADKHCQGQIEWHHNLIYAGRQQNEPFCILPLCSYHHSIEKNREIKPRLNEIMFSRATAEDKQKYPRLKWKR